MNKQTGLSCAAEKYLCTYEGILIDMMLGMSGAKPTDSISENFIVQMIPHHQAAIAMSRNILRYTDNDELKRIAGGIISSQTKSIENMRDIACTCGRQINTRTELNRYQCKVNTIIQVMFSEMINSGSGNCMNCDFLREMIPHHMGAVRMSRNALDFDICPQLKPILTAILVSQEEGIRQMRELLQKLDCKQ